MGRSHAMICVRKGTSLGEAISFSCCDDHQASADTSVSILDAYILLFFTCSSSILDAY
jgi:hypothetical protein